MKQILIHTIILFGQLITPDIFDVNVYHISL